MLHTLSAIGTFLVNNQTLLLTVVLPLVLALLKSTAWGKAHHKALLDVMQAVEDVGATNVKVRVANTALTAGAAVQAAITNSTDVVDPNKTPKPLAVRILQELARGVK